MIKIIHNISSSHVEFSIEDQGKKVPVSQWGDVEQSGCSLLLGWLQSDFENVVATDITINVCMVKIAMINDEMAADLDLPKSVSLVMHLQHEGIITQPQFCFKSQWFKADRSRRIAGAERIGCFLRIGEIHYRLPYQLFKIADGVERINSVLPDKIQDRLLVWHEIAEHFSQGTSHSITTDGFLNSTKVYFANAFELNVQQFNNDINFDPILLSSNINDESNFYDTTNEFERTLLPEDKFKKILVPEDQRAFSALFKSHQECRSNYPLGHGKYIIFSEQLHKTLTIVRKMQNAAITTKLEFLKNPKALFAEEGIDEEMLERIFSDRIEGYGERRIKIIPWIQIKGQNWLPDENSPKGFFIGDINLQISQLESLELEKEIRVAQAQGSTTVEFKGEIIPATNEMLAKIADHYPLKPIKHKKIESKNNDKKPLVQDFKNYVLYVKDNFSDIKYCPRLVSRNNVSSFTAPPNIVKHALKPHQLDGVKWLVESYRVGSSGVLLADDMGLGKTFQALAFLAWIRENMMECKIAKRPIMIVAPTGLLENWKNEHALHIHSPGLGDLLQVFGSNLSKLRDRTQKDALVKPLKTQMLKDADWILTTYETLSNYQTSFAGVQFAAVVFDEMQKIKTPNTRITEAAQTINADFRIGMTGTPIENRLGDLWCLVDTLQPARLGTLQQFSAKYEKSFCENASMQLKKELTESTVEMPALMLRRMKDTSLKDLPKIESHYETELMSRAQADAYMQIHDDAKKSSESGSHLEALQRLRAISLHPYVYKGDLTDETFISESARLRATFRVLDSIYKKREKVLIFIEYREWQQSDFLPAILKRRYKLTELPMVISGAIKGPERQKRVDKFQEDTGKFDVMIISPRAGGVGLTLTKANHVIHLSRWWNPAVEDQCTDRVYRIGQKKDVHVYYPMAKHPHLGDKSFDFCLNELLEKKRNLSRSLLIPPIGSDDIVRLNEAVFCDEKVIKTNKKRNYSLKDINCFEPRQFEDWVANECKQAGLIVQKTQISHDFGADLILKNTLGDIVGIIQCKHSQQKIGISYAVITDLLRANKEYQSLNSKLIAVTNASKFSESVYEYAMSNRQFKLIDANSILQTGNIIRDFVANEIH
jgi:superfamily II DNA or RNA helicase